MKTLLKPHLDDEIYEVEARIAARRERLPRVARDTGRSALHALASPAGLATAAFVGFLAGGGFRRNHKPRVKRIRTEEVETGKGVAIASLLMSGVVALIRAQFGSPLGMAQYVLEKIQSGKVQSGRDRPSAGHDRRPAVVPPRSVAG